MSWWQVRFSVPRDLADAAAYLLAESLDAAVEVQDETTMSRVDEAIEVVVGLAEAPEPDLAARINETLNALGLPPPALSTRKHDDDNWREGWKAFFQPAVLSARLGVHPPWAPAPPGVLGVVIEPGMAFGTGTHETTRASMRVLDACLADRPPLTVLDVGCGSGILSIGAARLGHFALGVEIDPEALPNAAENVARNGVTDRVELRQGSADTVEGQFPVVVANILAPILIAIAPALLARTGGELILSGMLDAQVDAVRAAFAELTLVERVDEGPWVVLRLRRDA
ncbi:MAG: 50S ribosomal protein L11 methyltransferase [Myxococcales bacterium]|nr:50S ribosomal protein L11 methyltransferase [Myxococcales bacterium]